MTGPHDPTAPQVPAAPLPKSGCLSFVIPLAFWTCIWLGLCFLLFWKVGQEAAAVAFFAPPVGVAVWAIFAKSPPRP